MTMGVVGSGQMIGLKVIGGVATTVSRLSAIEIGIMNAEGESH